MVRFAHGSQRRQHRFPRDPDPVRPSGADARTARSAIVRRLRPAGTRRRHLDVELGARRHRRRRPGLTSLAPTDRASRQGRSRRHERTPAANVTPAMAADSTDKQAAEAEAHVAPTADDRRRIPLRARQLHRRRRAVRRSARDRGSQPRPGDHRSVDRHAPSHRSSTPPTPPTEAAEPAPETTHAADVPAGRTGRPELPDHRRRQQPLRRSRFAASAAPSATGRASANAATRS